MKKAAHQASAANRSFSQEGEVSSALAALLFPRGGQGVVVERVDTGGLDLEGAAVGFGVPQARAEVELAHRRVGDKTAPIVFAQRGDDRLLVAFEGFEGRVGDASREERRRRAEEGVAAADVRVEEVERAPRLQRFEPQGDLAELDRHGVLVDAIEAAAHHVAEGVAHGLGGGFVVAGAHRREALRDASARGHEEVPRPAGRVAHGQREEGALGRRRARGLVEQRVERRVEEALHECCRGVVAPGGFALAAADGLQREGRGLAVELGLELRE